MNIPTLSLTIEFSNRVNVISSDVEIAKAQQFDPNLPPPHLTADLKTFKAIWDTGATCSVITQNVVQQLNLTPTGMTWSYNPGGKSLVNRYHILVALPNKVIFPVVNAIEGRIIGHHDVLIGMDIISTGDFAITSHNRKTVFSFRIPSVQCIDFTGKMRNLQHVKVGRNDPCPCGSGKKYKNCHGKTT